MFKIMSLPSKSLLLLRKAKTFKVKSLAVEIKEIIVKVIIRNILYKRYKIQKIKEQVNL